MDTPGSRPRTHNGQMIDVDDSQFEDMVKRALDSLPPKLGAEMANVAVTVQLEGGRPGLLGLYQGIPLPKRTTTYAGVLPDRLTIYQNGRASCRERVRKNV